MEYLLDTHIALWWLSEPEKLAKKAIKVIEDRENHLFVSCVSFWEMAIKQSIGRLTVPASVIETLNADSIETLPLIAEDALAIADLPMLHQDPFDRMLVVQAKRHNLTLVTHDKKLADYPVSILLA